jgi:cyclin G-associated kinase
MTDFFKSALGYLGTAAASMTQENDFIGQYVEIGQQKLHVRKLIAEGS